MEKADTYMEPFLDSLEKLKDVFWDSEIVQVSVDKEISSTKKWIERNLEDDEGHKSETNLGTLDPPVQETEQNRSIFDDVDK